MSDQRESDVSAAQADALEKRAAVERLHAKLDELAFIGFDTNHRPVNLRAGGRGHQGPLTAHPDTEPTRADLQRAQQRYDSSWAVYLEAARARDVREANALTESNIKVALANVKMSRAVVWLTVVLATTAAVQTAATVVQLVHTWRK